MNSLKRMVDSTPRLWGFTLMEMLVALAIFSMITLISSQFLRQTIFTTDLVLSRGERTEEIHRAMLILTRDLHQVVMRGIRDEGGEVMDPFSLDASVVLEFTRTGRSNYLNQARSTMQRVQYVVEHGSLIRRFWPVLDRALETEAVEQTLITNIQDAEFSIIDSRGEEQSTFPQLTSEDPNAPPIDPLDPTAAAESIVPFGVRIRFFVHPIGDIERLWTIPVLPEIYIEVDEEGNPVET